MVALCSRTPDRAATEAFHGGIGAFSSGVSPSFMSSSDNHPEQVPTDFSKLVVVLVEPSRFQVKLVRSYLTELGVTSIHVARTGKEAIELVDRTDRDRVETRRWKYVREVLREHVLPETAA